MTKNGGPRKRRDSLVGTHWEVVTTLVLKLRFHHLLIHSFIRSFIHPLIHSFKAPLGSRHGD